MSLTWTLAERETPPRILGDFNRWEPGHGRHSAGRVEWSYDVEPDARLEYCFLTPDNRLVPDPGNPYRVWNGLGPMSELVMPEYRYHPVFEPFRHGVKGQADGLRKVEVESRKLGYTKDVWILDLGLAPVLKSELKSDSVSKSDSNPKTKSESDSVSKSDSNSKTISESDSKSESKSKSLIVFQDGLDYIEFAQAAVILQHLYDEKSIPAVTALFVNPPNRHKEGKPDRMTEYGMNEQYAAFLAEELVPRFSSTAGHAIIGASYGGLCAIHTALLYPEVFATAYSQSGYVGFRRDAIFRLVGSAAKPVRIIAETGTWERSVGRTFLAPAETDFTAANRRFSRLLAGCGLPCIYNEHHEGHTWGYWRNGLVRMLPVIMKPVIMKKELL